MREIKREDCTITLKCEEEHLEIEGNAQASGDDAQDAAQEQWVRDQLDSGNAWAWCLAVVTVRFKSLEATDSLGACSYHSEADFKQPGGYYDDMIDTCIATLNEQARDIARSLVEPEIEAIIAKLNDICD